MPGDRITLATVPDHATAELLKEALVDGGIGSVELRSAVGVAYVPQMRALQYEVRVDDVDEAEAKKILAHFEAESQEAVTRQAERGLSDDEISTPPRRRWVFWLALVFVLLWLLPFAWSVAGIVRTFIAELFG